MSIILGPASGFAMGKSMSFVGLGLGLAEVQYHDDAIKLG